MKLDRKEIRKILDGKLTELTVAKQYRPGQLISLVPLNQRKATCRIIVISHQHEDDEHRITFVVDRSEPGRFLHRRSEHGYTEDPRLSLSREPEAVDEATLDGFARTCRENFESANREELRRREAKGRAARLRDIEHRAGRAGVDLSAEIAKVEQALLEMSERLARGVA